MRIGPLSGPAQSEGPESEPPHCGPQECGQAECGGPDRVRPIRPSQLTAFRLAGVQRAGGWVPAHRIPPGLRPEGRSPEGLSPEGRSRGVQTDGKRWSGVAAAGRPPSGLPPCDPDLRPGLQRLGPPIRDTVPRVRRTAPGGPRVLTAAHSERGTPDLRGPLSTCRPGVDPGVGAARVESTCVGPAGGCFGSGAYVYSSQSAEVA